MDLDRLQEERRKLGRAKVYASVNYRLKSQEKSRATLSRDISEEGISLLSEEFIARDTDFLLEINLPSISKTVSALGRVVWALRLPHSERYQLGLKFVEINDSHRKDILGYLKKLKAKSGLSSS